MEFTFILKKIIAYSLDPLSIVFGLFIVGIFYLYKANTKKALKFLLSSLFLLLLFSNALFANFLISHLESSYPKYDYKTPITYIHVLGNGHNTDTAQPISSHLNATSTKRVLEGVIIYKKTGDTKIIFTGYSGETNSSNAKMNAELAVALGVAKEDIILDESALDTEDEATFSKNIIANEPFALVTSATHMSRAMKIFTSHGMHPIAAPTNFYKSNFLQYMNLQSANSLELSTIAMHEYYGRIFFSIKHFLLL